MRNSKILKIAVILLSIFFVVSFGLSQVIGSDYFKNMFWASTALLAVGLILDLNAWSKLGLDVDKNKSKTIKRSFDDSTTLLVVFFGTGAFSLPLAPLITCGPLISCITMSCSIEIVPSNVRSTGSFTSLSPFLLAK